MSYIAVTNVFVNGTTANATDVNTNFNDIVNGLKGGTLDLNVRNIAGDLVQSTVASFATCTLGRVNGSTTLSGSLTAAGVTLTGSSSDIYTTDWARWTPTLGNMGAIDRNRCWYKKIGQQIYVMMDMSAEVLVNPCTFTLPVAFNSGIDSFFTKQNIPVGCWDYTAGLGVEGWVEMSYAATTCTFRVDINAVTTWTVSSSVGILGSFWYPCD